MNGSPFLGLYGQGQFEKFFWEGRQFLIFYGDFPRSLNLFEILFDRHPVVKGFPSQHFVQDYSQRPDVTFFTVSILRMAFRRHVRRWTHVILNHGSLPHDHLAVPEIDDDGVTVAFDHDVGGFKVPVDEERFDDGNIPGDNFSKNINGFLFIEFS